VIILGAGATVNAARDIGLPEENLCPPLDVDFFQRAEILSRRNRSGKSLVELRKRELEHVINKTELFRSPWASYPFPTMETFFSDVYYETWDGSDEARLVLVVLLRLFAALIGKTTNWMCENRRLSSLGRLIKWAVASAEGDAVSLVTFNQDLVTENELLLLPPECGSLSLGSLYGDIGLNPSFGHEYGEKFFDIDSGLEESERTLNLRVRKMHGSLNWVFHQEDRNQDKDYFLDSESAEDRPVYLTRSRLIRPEMQPRSSTSLVEFPGGWLLPLVIPPIYNKNPLIDKGIIRSVWESARQDLINAETIIMFGYSMPPADGMARLLIRRSLAVNTNSLEISCINPQADIENDIRESLGVPVVKRFTTVDEYLAA
jgi:hypothetical protein